MATQKNPVSERGKNANIFFVPLPVRAHHGSCVEIRGQNFQIWFCPSTVWASGMKFRLNVKCPNPMGYFTSPSSLSLSQREHNERVTASRG